MNSDMYSKHKKEKKDEETIQKFKLIFWVSFVLFAMFKFPGLEGGNNISEIIGSIAGIVMLYTGYKLFFSIFKFK